MSYIYNREHPRCTCPRCRFAEVNSQPRKSAHENTEPTDMDYESEIQLLPVTDAEKTADRKVEVIDAEKTTEQKVEVIDAEKTTEQKAEVIDAEKTTEQKVEVIGAEKTTEQKDEVIDTEKTTDRTIETVSTLIPIIETKSDNIELTIEPQLKNTVVHGGMENFVGPIPVGWSSDTPHLVSLEDGYGLVHSGGSSARLRDGARLSFTAVNTGTAGSTLSFFALGTGRQTGLHVKAYYTSPVGEKECASLFIRKGDLPQEKGGFGYYVFNIPPVPSGNIDYRIEFSASALRRQCVLLDDVAFY